jgi:hypothetical protein
MLLKIIYLLFAVVVDLLIYSKLHKKNWLNNTQFNLTCTVLILFVLLHLFNLSFLSPFSYLSPLIFFSLFPVVSYFWFNYFAIKRITSIKTPQNESFMVTGLKVFSFFFLKMVYIMALIMQIAFVFSLLEK